ncbi:MAG: hypothetical protein ABIP94_24800 [Planctomycetota bacterium]
MLRQVLPVGIALAVAGATRSQTPGLRIFSPSGANQTQMVDGQGVVVHSWPGTARHPGHDDAHARRWLAAARHAHPGLLTPALVGLHIGFAHLVFDSSLQNVHASNPVPVTLVL